MLFEILVGDMMLPGVVFSCWFLIILERKRSGFDQSTDIDNVDKEQASISLVVACITICFSDSARTGVAEGGY